MRHRPLAAASFAFAIAACSDGPTATVTMERVDRVSAIEFPCDEYPHDPQCQTSYWDIGGTYGGGGGFEGQCELKDNCRYFPLSPFFASSDIAAAWLDNEVWRLRVHSDWECRQLGTKAWEWWDAGRVFGYNETVRRWSNQHQKWGYLGGDVHHPGNWEINAYEMHIHVGSRSREQVNFTFRHEVAHAMGIVDENEADWLAEKCK